MTESAKNEVDRGAKPGASKVLVALVVCNLLTVGGLGGYILFGSGSRGAAAASEEAAPEAGAVEGEPAKGNGKEQRSKESTGVSASAGGPTANLGSFVINLSDPGASRYLKAVLKAEVSSPATGDELGQREAQVRDAIISYLSSLTLRETQGARAKAQIRESIQQRVNNLLQTGELRQVFFTEFVTQ